MVHINEAVGITFIATATTSCIITASICSVIAYYIMRRMNVHRKEQYTDDHEIGGVSNKPQSALYEEVHGSVSNKEVIEVGENVSYGHVNRR